MRKDEFCCERLMMQRRLAFKYPFRTHWSQISPFANPDVQRGRYCSASRFPQALLFAANGNNYAASDDQTTAQENGQRRHLTEPCPGDSLG